MAVIACAPVNAARYGMPAYTPPEPAGGLRGVRDGSAAHNAVGLAGESPVMGIDCLPT